MSSKCVLRVYCPGCGELVGDLDEGELGHLVNDTDEAQLCFTCQPGGADRTSECVMGLEEDDTIFIGDLGFHIEAGRMFPFVTSHACTPESTRARGLSSYTYLNRIEKSWAVLDELQELCFCPFCNGYSSFDGENFAVPCHHCSNTGYIRVLKPWVRFIVDGVRADG